MKRHTRAFTPCRHGLIASVLYKLRGLLVCPHVGEFELCMQAGQHIDGLAQFLVKVATHIAQLLMQSPTAHREAETAKAHRG